MTIKTHGRMFTDNTVGITQLDITDGTANQAIVTDGQGVLRFATAVSYTHLTLPTTPYV